MTTPNKKLIWDIPTRLFHWLLVIGIAYAWYSIEIMEDMEQHFIAGYCVLGLMLFRLIWGFAGTRYARFASFLFTPGRIVTYAKTLLRRGAGSYAGHNPLGGLAVLCLLLVILAQAITGLFSNDEYYYFGPLSEKVSADTATTFTNFHKFNFNIILGLAALHILAILFYQFFKRDNLILPMLTGHKRDENLAYEAIPGSRLILAVILAGLCAGGVYVLANYV